MGCLCCLAGWCQGGSTWVKFKEEAEKDTFNAAKFAENIDGGRQVPGYISERSDSLESRNLDQARQYKMTCIGAIGRIPFNTPQKFFQCNMMLDWVLYTPLNEPFYINASLPLLSRVKKQVKLIIFLTGVTKFNTTLSYTWPPRKRRKLVYKSQGCRFAVLEMAHGKAIRIVTSGRYGQTWLCGK